MISHRDKRHPVAHCLSREESANEIGERHYRWTVRLTCGHVVVGAWRQLQGAPRAPAIGYCTRCEALDVEA